MSKEWNILSAIILASAGIVAITWFVAKALIDAQKEIE